MLAIALLLTFSTALAGGQVKSYELAESGITIEFQMTAEEIAVEEEENSRLATLSVANGNDGLKIAEVFEMGESGQSLSFPLTAEEVAAEDLKDAGSAILRKVDSGQPKDRVIVFELTESGQVIGFQVKSTDAVMACGDISTERNC
jgi:hypothetical protein